MLRIAQLKARAAGVDGTRFVCADVLHTPLRTAGFDAATMAFGLRNVEDPAAAVAEIHRVLRPGGRLAILELSRPSRLVRGPFLAYFEHIMPLIGRLVSHNREAYRYLPESVEAFPTPERVAALIADAGFEQVRTIPFSHGVAHCYTARKPRAPEAPDHEQIRCRKSLQNPSFATAGRDAQVATSVSGGSRPPGSETGSITLLGKDRS